MRQRSGSMLCPSCRKLISVDEKRCPFCGAVRPGLWGWGPSLQRLFGGRLDLVVVLVAACALLYVVTLLLGGVQSRNPLLFLSPSMEALYRLGMTGGWAAAHGHWWTVITAVYLHGGLLHILFNMMALRQLGQDAQEIFGPARFFVLFTLTGAAGFVLSNLVRPTPSIGASGAIFGLVGALIAYHRRRGGTMGAMITRQMLQWVVIMFVFGLMASRVVNNLAHLGGLASGFALGQILPGRDERHDGRGTQLLALALLGLTLAAFVLGLVHPPVLFPGD